MSDCDSVSSPYAGITLTPEPLPVSDLSCICRRGQDWKGGLMAKAQAEEFQTQLATRIPKSLHRRLRLYCVTHDIVLMHFVTEAIEEMLGRKARGGRRTRSEGTS